jgi:hypothetical protein
LKFLQITIEKEIMLSMPLQTPACNPPIVTIWVHGTKVDECLPLPFAKIAKRIGNMIFQHKLGLHHVNSFNNYHYEAIRANILGTTPPILFPNEHFYSFGWSGKLNPIARKNASQELFDALKSLQKEIEAKTGQQPLFMVITHSHGGNVVLHMAEIIDPDGFEPRIEKLILLACPVQKCTSHLINSPLFKRIYSLHSHTDMIQIADMQGLRKHYSEKKPFFSERHFDVNPKLVQANIRWACYPEWDNEDYIINEVMLKHLTRSIRFMDYIKKNRGLFHVEFQLFPFLRNLSSIIARLDLLFEEGAQCGSHKDHDILIEL